MKRESPLRKIISSKKVFWLFLGPVFYGLFRLSFLWPGFTETVYSRSVFRLINQGVSTVTGLLPFSLAEFLLYAFVLFVAVYLIIMIVRSVIAKKAWWRVLLGRFVTLLCVFSTIYALFVASWGFNYSRQTLGETLAFDTTPATVSELAGTCESLITQAKALRSAVPEDADGGFSPDATRTYYMQNTSRWYNAAASSTGNPFLGGSFGQAKPVLYSVGLSYAEITGVYFPFTGEANINADVPMLFFPSSCLHESAHQRGFAREDEANFLAYYVSLYADDTSVTYSGTMLALVHAMNALYQEDRDTYATLRDTYSAGMARDLENNSAYWQLFEGPIGDVSQDLNNTYLHANMQQDGIKSYGRMVDLLIALWRKGGI